MKARVRAVLRVVDRFLDRWLWLAAAIFTALHAAQGDGIGAGIWGVFAGVKLQQRFAAEPARNELRIGMSKVDADEIRRAVLEITREQAGQGKTVGRP